MLYTAQYIPIAAAQDANSHPPRLVKRTEISHISQTRALCSRVIIRRYKRQHWQLCHTELVLFCFSTRAEILKAVSVIYYTVSVAASDEINCRLTLTFLIRKSLTKARHVLLLSLFTCSYKCVIIIMNACSSFAMFVGTLRCQINNCIFTAMCKSLLFPSSAIFNSILLIQFFCQYTFWEMSIMYVILQFLKHTHPFFSMQLLLYFYPIFL